MKKKHFSDLIVIISLLIFQNSYAGDTHIVKVGAFNNSPVIFQDRDGIIKGFYVDLLEGISQKENISFEYVFGSWNECLNNIKSGNIDLLPGAGFLEERAVYADYGKNSLLTVWGELYTLKSSGIHGILDISGKKIGVAKGDILTRNFQELTAKFGIRCTFVELYTYDDIFEWIAAGRVDAGIAEVTYGAVKQSELGLNATGVVFNPTDYYFITPKNKNRDLMLLLDKYIDQWKHQDNSVYNQAKKNWMNATVGTVSVIPGWLSKLLIILGISTAIAMIFIVLLKLQVKKATNEIRQREAALEESEEIFNQFLQHSPIYVFFKDNELRSIRLSANYMEMLGKPMSELIGKSMMDLFPSELALKMIEDERRILKIGKEVSIEEEINGRYYTTIKFPFRIADKTEYLAGFTIDITDRKLAEDKIRNLLSEKELLLREVHHRIKNNMNTIKGLLSLQIAAEENPSVLASLRDAESRVQSILMLYDRLYCTDNYRELPVKNFLEPLAMEVSSSFNHENSITVETEIEDFILNVNKLTPIGIIVNELLTNAMKYAFNGKQDGHIYIRAMINGSRVHIEVQDNGIGFPDTVDFNNSTGFGLNLVQMLIEQLDGSISIERGEGVKFSIEFEV